MDQQAQQDRIKIHLHSHKDCCKHVGVQDGFDSRVMGHINHAFITWRRTHVFPSSVQFNFIYLALLTIEFVTRQSYRKLDVDLDPE